MSMPTCVGTSPCSRRGGSPLGHGGTEAHPTAVEAIFRAVGGFLYSLCAMICYNLTSKYPHSLVLVQHGSRPRIRIKEMHLKHTRYPGEYCITATISWLI
jgi:hypothetical protein